MIHSAVSSKWPYRAPEGHVLLRGFLGGGRDPHRLERPDEELIATARDALTETLGISGDPIFTRLYRWTRQSPQYEVGHLERVAILCDCSLATAKRRIAAAHERLREVIDG